MKEEIYQITGLVTRTLQSCHDHCPIRTKFSFTDNSNLHIP